MSRSAQTLPKKEVPERIRRELKTGETIYHSTMACHMSAKFPEGKWIGQVRRDEKGRLVKYPVKGFGTPREALDYVKGLRPDAKGNVAAPRQGEATVADLYQFVTNHRQKRLGENSKKQKEIRWRLHIEPEWGSCPLSQVTRRAAQEWVTDVEAKIAAGTAGTLGFPQFERVRVDLHSLFECIDSFSPLYEDRKNPFATLDFTPQPPRTKVTIESRYFAALTALCPMLSREELCTEWIGEMFLTSLLSGLREGEVMALCRDQLDFTNGAILVDGALRRNSRAIDPKTRLEFGPILRQAMHYPKGGTASNRKIRLVPMSDQLAVILKKAVDQAPVTDAAWNLIWPSETGKIREESRFRKAWSTLTKRLAEVATYAPIEHKGGSWPEPPKHRGWPQNTVVEAARRDCRLRLANLFESIDFRDTRNSFASYMNEIGLSQATREHVLGHASGLTNRTYTVVTDGAFQDARKRLSEGWELLSS